VEIIEVQAISLPEEEIEILDSGAVGVLPPFPNPFRHPMRATGWIVRTLFGIASLILLLAVIAAIPLVNFLALGYLLEVEGRIGRTGKIRHAFPLLALAPRVGMIVLGIFLWLFPIRVLADRAADASLIDPGSATAAGLNTTTGVVAILIGVHLCLALARGGSMGCFLRPIRNIRWLVTRLKDGDYWVPAEWNIREFVAGLRLKHHFWLGIRGFAGAFLWLLVPTSMLAAASRTDGLIAITVLGGLTLIVVFAWMPFLQARFAAENRFGAMFELRTIQELFRRAPFSWLLTVVLVYVLALPLYLAKVKLPP